MNNLTHQITAGLKAGLHVRIIKDGSWVLVADIDGTEHKVRRKQLSELHIATGRSPAHTVGSDVDHVYMPDSTSSDTTTGHGDTSSSISDTADDPIDVWGGADTVTEDSEVERELAECDDEHTSQDLVEEHDSALNPKSMSDAFHGRRAKYKETDGCGDELQIALKGSSPLEVAQLAAILLELPQMELVKKYAHLNSGQVRMNSGNRIRALVKKGQKSVEDVVQAREDSEFYDEDEIEALFNEGL
ncbi:hypothetical protein [Vibrio coralliilyticus]|uniref:hypothetical protein n=1 Tax=Vibrio coralliilyticus TaxID=190893 RepID=UPI0017C34A1E|nr:hypothetical protein [Vibrio coralliilyticus]NUW69906.1 hypothetical protein [Vibrio coralliilyticus]